jgi:hypothetical protein
LSEEESIIKKLITITRESDLLKFLNSLDIADSTKPPKGHKFMWRLLNDSMSNAANIHTTTVTIAPIIERVTNGFDACIELEEYKHNKGEKIPRERLPVSPRDAVEKWFNIPGGDTAIFGVAMPDPARTKLSESLVNVELHDSDDPRNPTVVIHDFGIGQHPDEFIKTLLSLGRSNKFTSPHLHGTYGHGGASTYRFCKYSIIVSRRNPIAADKKDDQVGWSIVRTDESLEFWDYKTNKLEYINHPPVYEYLCLSDGSIPKISFKVAKKYLEGGTYISHIEYKAKEWENLSRGLGYRLFRNYLFDPVLPFRLIDKRESRESFARNMFGDRSVLETAPYVVYHNIAEEKWPNGGKLVVRYWLLHNQDDPASRPLGLHLERENSRNSIIVTLNGQRHGTLEKSLISKKSRLPRVSESLLVQVVLDDLPREVKGRLFTSGRNELVKEGIEIELLEQKLIDIFMDDKKLEDWENKLGEIRSQDDESIKTVTQMLDKLLNIGIETGIGGSEKLSIFGGAGIIGDYVFQDPPTTFKIKNAQDPLEFVKNEKRIIIIELNGPNNLFSRRNNRGLVKVILPEESGLEVSVLTSKFKDGRLPVTIFAKNDAIEFETKQIKFIFQCENLVTDLGIERNYIIVPPEQYIAVDPPTEFKILRKSPIYLTSGKNNTISIGFNGPNDILVRTTNRAQFDVSFDYKYASYIRRIGPFNGKFQITIFIDKKAKENDTFDIECKLKLANGTQLSDIKNCIIVPEKEQEEKKKGGETTVSKPNYKIKRVRKDDWEILGWNEEKVGKFGVKKDEEGKDILELMVNVDSHYIEDERNRRRNQRQNEKSVQNIENKYVAYIAYHQFLQYDAEKEEYSSEVIKKEESSEGIKKEESNGNELTDEQKEEEMKRVAKTLVLSFRTLKALDESE